VGWREVGWEKEGGRGERISYIAYILPCDELLITTHLSPCIYCLDSKCSPLIGLFLGDYGALQATKVCILSTYTMPKPPVSPLTLSATTLTFFTWSSSLRTSNLTSAVWLWTADYQHLPSPHPHPHTRTHTM